MELLDRLRLPVGSLVVDLSLVLFVTFMAGQMVQRLEAIDERVAALEIVRDRATPESDRRLSVLENEVAQHDREMDQLRREILERLTRIEVALSQHTDKQH